MKEKYIFNYPIKLDDLDYQGHVGNANWMIILQRARIDLCSQLGYPYSQMDKDGVGGVVAEANIKYYYPAFNDDDISVQVYIDKPEKNSLWLKHKCKNQNGKLCLVADIKIVFINREGTPVNIPVQIMNTIEISQ